MCSERKTIVNTEFLFQNVRKLKIRREIKTII